MLVGCGVPTGWGSAVYTADVAPGDTVAVYGVGGIGINAVQGARYEEAQQAITELTRGQGADSAILTVGVMTADVVAAGFNAVGKGGTVVVTGLN